MDAGQKSAIENGFVKDTPPSFLTKKEGDTAKKRFEIHPMFLLDGLACALFGNLFVFIAATLVALQHELAHALCAAKRGYKLNRVVLMPYGAVIDGDVHGFSLSDELIIAAAGPLCNGLTAVGFLALWWCFPALYPYTDTAFYLSLSIGLVNLLPAYPLDGGRILKAFLSKGLGEEKARKICKAFSFFISASMLTFFFLFLFDGKRNFSLLLFALFILFGNLGGKTRSAFYEKISYSSESDFLRGAEIKKVAVGESFPLKKTLRFFERGRWVCFEVYEKSGRKIAEISQAEIAEWFESDAYSAKISDFLLKRGKKD